MPSKPRQISPANAWCFTLNNWTEAELEFLSSEFFEDTDNIYFIIGKELGEQGTPHLQGYVCCIDKNKKFRPLPKFAVMRGLPGEEQKQAIHWERAKGGRAANYDYCSKEGDFFGTLPQPPRNEELNGTLSRLELEFNLQIDYTMSSEDIQKAQKRKEDLAVAYLTLKGEW